jgi:hypothetical protein
MAGSAPSADFPLTAGQLRRFEVLRTDPALRSEIWRGVRITGELHIDQFIDSVEMLVARHDALRIEIVDRPGDQPCQRIRGLPPRADLISCQDVVARSEEQFNRYIRHLVAQDRRQQRGAWSGYPFTFRLFRYGPAVHVLVVGLSHLAVDGIGAEILIRDLIRIYGDTLAGRSPCGLPGRSFADSVRRSAALSTEEPRRSATRNPPDLFMPTRFDVSQVGPGEPGCRSRVASFSLSGAELAALRARARLHHCTEFTWMLAAFAKTVFQFTSQDLIKVYSPVDLRAPSEREVVGMYALGIPLVIERPPGTGGGRDFAAGVGNTVLRAMLRCRRGAIPPAGFQADLKVIYQKFDAQGSREFRLGATDYLPQVTYVTPGVSVEFLSYPAVLDVCVTLDPAKFSREGANDVSGALRRNMAPDSGR